MQSRHAACRAHAAHCCPTFGPSPSCTTCSGHKNDVGVVCRTEKPGAGRGAKQTVHSTLVQLIWAPTGQLLPVPQPTPGWSTPPAWLGVSLAGWSCFTKAPGSRHVLPASAILRQQSCANRWVGGGRMGILGLRLSAGACMCPAVRPRLHVGGQLPTVGAPARPCCS